MSKASHITGLSVEGFKSLGKKQRIDIRPLTLLAGANSSGKSSIMQPLLLLKQTLEASGDSGAIQLSGQHVQFTAVEQLWNKELADDRDSILRVGIELGNEDQLLLSYKRKFERQRRVSLDVHSMEWSVSGERFVLRRDMSSDSLERLLPDYLRDYLADLGKNAVGFKVSVERRACFFAFAIQIIEPGTTNTRVPFHELPWPLSLYTSRILEILHLPGLRGNPQRTYRRMSVGQRYLGTMEEYVASVINNWSQTAPKKLKVLSEMLIKLGLTWKVMVEPFEDTQFQVKVGRLTQSRRGGAHDTVSIADVGIGVSQTLPVLVALIAAEPGQLVYLEQPEIHLHPKAQGVMAEIIAETARRGVQIVAETHSSLLLKRVQTLIARGELSNKNVALHWFSRDADGCTQVDTADIDENGAFGDWPIDFDDVELAAEREYLDAVENRSH